MCRMDNEFESNALPAQLLLNMRAIYGQLKRAERSAADLILTDPAHLAEMTIAEAAQTCGVSQPTFVRIARRIGFYGVGDAKIVAESAYHKFNRMGAVCDTSNDPDVQLVQASQLAAGDVCVLVSHSGRSRTTVATARRAREMGATVVSITNYPYSPLARMSDYVLTTASFMEHSGEVITKRISELVIIESLFISVLLRGGERYQQALARSNEALVENKL